MLNRVEIVYPRSMIGFIERRDPCLLRKHPTRLCSFLTYLVSSYRSLNLDTLSGMALGSGSLMLRVLDDFGDSEGPFQSGVIYY